MEQITHLEELSKLEFTEEERKAFKNEFSAILKFIAEIEKVDLGAHETTPNSKNVSDLRDDEVKASIETSEALKNAPRARDGCYVCPLVID